MNPALESATDVWQTIAADASPASELRAALDAAGVKVSGWADGMFARMDNAPRAPGDITLIRTTVRDLGFTFEPTTAELWTRIKEIGELCDPYDALHLRLAFSDQTEGDWLWVAMPQIVGDDGHASVFIIRRSETGAAWLDADCAGPGSRWNLSGKIAFRERPTR